MPQGTHRDHPSLKQFWGPIPNRAHKKLRDIASIPYWLVISNPIYHVILAGGIPTPLKNMKVSWDDDSQLNGKIKHVPNHQLVLVSI